ncbi:MAG: hypothetical protein ABL879_07815 [Devosia sp.]
MNSAFTGVWEAPLNQSAGGDGHGADVAEAQVVGAGHRLAVDTAGDTALAVLLLVAVLVHRDAVGLAWLT